MEESHKPKLFFKVHLNKSLTKNRLSDKFKHPDKLNLFCFQVISLIGHGPIDPTVILQKLEVLEVLL